MTATHRIPASDFVELAAAGGRPGSAAMLRAGQFSKNALMLRSIMEVARRHYSAAYRSSAFENGYDLLCAVQERAPATVATVLAHPQVGSWVCECRRTLDGSDVGEASAQRLLGQLNAVAVAAATRAGHACDLLLPVHRGRVFLPTLGLASFGAEAVDTWARARFDGRDLRLTAGPRAIVVPADHQQDGPGWLGLRRVIAETAGLRLEIDLDDIGPFRGGTSPPPADRLNTADHARWRRLVEDAWNLLVTVDRDRAETTAEVTTTLIPLAGGGNAASRDAFGAIYFGPAAGGPELAEILVHECQHAKLNALLDLVALYVPSCDTHYSPARDDPRPIGGALHGCYALAGVADFWRRRGNVADGPMRNHAQLQCSYRLGQVLRAIRMLSDAGRLTTTGHDFVNGLIARLELWDAEPVPERQRDRGRAMANDHYLRWRLHNIRHDETYVREIAVAWHRRRPAAPRVDTSRSVVATRPVGDIPSGREQLRNIQALTPDRFEDLGNHLPTEASGADVLYVRGDHAAAVREYLGQIAHEPDETEHWAGLALAARELPAANDMDVLLEYPDFVYAVHRALRDAGEAPSPWDLAQWLTPDRTPAR